VLIDGAENPVGIAKDPAICRREMEKFRER
jgi:hypothetical protein